MKLIPIKYHNLKYPVYIKPRIIEVAAHFDINKLPSYLENNNFSLHTEYSAKKRNFNNHVIQKYKSLVTAQPNPGKPKLWVSKNWAREFAYFLIELLDGKIPKIIEIHPPNSRSTNLNEFIEYFKVFENIFLNKDIRCEILIENRNGFRISGIDDFIELFNIIDKEKISLKLIVDFPQLLNYEKAKKDPKVLNETMEKIKSVKHNINAIHLWGQNGRNSHSGDMLDYFDQNIELKNIFFSKLGEVFNDLESEMYFIPEINAGANGKTREQCLENIVHDLEQTGFIFYTNNS
ncbi:hypothetical protein [Nitrosophilus kaiyonis]|uniref:hypothetical protein n=1 Tax=Nitrosophilus kaiyonis TaxID=2930200 RepID=UPI0024927AEC|nr:hypothetical protein [Nitrosophilus kaiyonis]